MRKALLLSAVLVACSTADTPPADTAAPAAAAPARMNLTASDLSGRWNGTTQAATGDSVVARWVAENVSDSTGTLTYEGSNTAIPFTSRIDGDSVVMLSAPFDRPGAPRNAPKVRFSSVGRLQNGQLTGTSQLVLATMTDSVLSNRRFVATRAQQ